MKELTLINMAALKKCGVLDGHALRIVDALKKKPAPSAPVAGSSASDFMKLRKFHHRDLSQRLCNQNQVHVPLE